MGRRWLRGGFKSEFLCFESQLGFEGVSIKTVYSDGSTSRAAQQHLAGRIYSFVAVSYFILLLKRLPMFGSGNCPGSEQQP